jgi:hypothetical protein
VRQAAHPAGPWHLIGARRPRPRPLHAGIWASCGVVRGAALRVCQQTAQMYMVSLRGVSSGFPQIGLPENGSSLRSTCMAPINPMPQGTPELADMDEVIGQVFEVSVTCGSIHPQQLGDDEHDTADQLQCSRYSSAMSPCLIAVSTGNLAHRLPMLQTARRQMVTF